jgi:hypothetical protein
VANWAHYFDEGYSWWLRYAEEAKISDAEKELIRRDGGRWIALGLLVGSRRRISRNSK